MTWLYSRTRDLFILVVPAVVTLIAFALATRTHDASRAYAGWFAQFALGNSTHVILTFLLLGLRRDVLKATRGQAVAQPFGGLIPRSAASRLAFARVH